MNDIKELKLEHVNTPFGEAIKFNFPIKEIFDYLGCKENYDFFSKLNEYGFNFKNRYLIIASKQDYNDYMSCNSVKEPAIGCGIERKKRSALRNIMFNTLCIDKEIRDPSTGKAGAVDYSGRMVVPEIFDGVICTMYPIDTDIPGIVIKDGKYNLTPRDGSGTLLTDWFDSFFRSAGFIWIERNKRYGLIKALEAKEVIPCEMDWMVGHRLKPSIIIFGKNGKLGFADARFGFNLCHYESPKYDAIDITEGKFLLDNKWTDGPIGAADFRHIMNVNSMTNFGSWAEITDFFSTNKTPHPDIGDVILGREYLKKPLFVYHHYLASLEFFMDELYKATTILKDLNRQNIYFTIRLQLPKNAESLISGIDVKLIDGNSIATPRWGSMNQELLKRDLKYSILRNFRAIVSDSGGKFNLNFVRDFPENDFETISKLLADYIERHLNIDSSSINTELILNTLD